MTKTNPRTRAIALALAALMLVGLLPMTVSASTIGTQGAAKSCYGCGYHLLGLYTNHF